MLNKPKKVYYYNITVYGDSNKFKEKLHHKKCRTKENFVINQINNNLHKENV